MLMCSLPALVIKKKNHSARFYSVVTCTVVQKRAVRKLYRQTCRCGAFSPNCTLWKKMKELCGVLGLDLTLNHGPIRLIKHKPAETSGSFKTAGLAGMKEGLHHR